MNRVEALRKLVRYPQDVIEIRKALPDLLGGCTDQEIDELYSRFSESCFAAGWLDLEVLKNEEMRFDSGGWIELREWLETEVA